MIVEAALVLAIGGQSDAAVVRELEKMEHQLAETYKAGDCTAWGAMLAPEWSVTHITAQVLTKAQALEMCAAAKSASACASSATPRSSPGA
jgi:hypothetical protein